MSEVIEQKKRQPTAKKRGRGKPFVHGDPRANTAGRPPLTPTEREVRELARQKSIACLERLEELGLESGGHAVRANEAILERAWGKPKEQVEVSTTTGGVMIMLPPKDEDA